METVDAEITIKSPKTSTLNARISCDKLKRLRIKRNKRKNYHKHLRKLKKKHVIGPVPSDESQSSSTFFNINFLTEWHSQHNAEYWKTRVLNLEFENRKLHERIEKLQRLHSNCRKRKGKRKRVHSEKSVVEIQVSDEWIKCIAENKKIREQVKKERENFEGQEEEEEKASISEELEKNRRQELKELYGEGAAEVKAYDAAVSLINKKYLSLRK